MPNTVNRQYPYPVPASDPDVPYWLQQLAEKLDVGDKAFADAIKALQEVPHKEFTGSIAVPSSSLWGTGALATDAASTQVGSAISSPAPDKVTFPAGIWDVSWRARMSVPSANTNTWGSFRDDGGNEYESFDIPQGMATGSRVLRIRTQVPMTISLKFWTTTSGVTLTSRVKVTRVASIAV